MIEWKTSDPRVDLIDWKHASIIILRPHPNGDTRWEAATGYAEMKHSWYVQTSFDNRSMIIDEWPEGWLWTLAPTDI